MSTASTLLLIPAILEAGTLLVTAAASGAADSRAARVQTILRRQLPLSFGFFAACGAALYTHSADALVVIFAAMFVLAGTIHAVLYARGDEATAALAIRAAVVALAGLVALVALDALIVNAGDSIP